MQGNNILIALVVVVVVAAGAYYMLAQPQAPIAIETVDPNALPAATDSVDDFAAAIRADMDATAAAIQAFDVDVDTSISDVTSAGDSSQLYDPENI